MEKNTKKYKDLKYFEFNENGADCKMSGDVIDTFNQFMKYYKTFVDDVCKETNDFSKNEIEDLATNTKKLMLKIFHKYQKDIEELLSSEEIKETFREDVKKKEDVKKNLARYFFALIFYNIQSIKKKDEEILESFQYAINVKKKQIENDKDSNNVLLLKENKEDDSKKEDRKIDENIENINNKEKNNKQEDKDIKHEQKEENYQERQSENSQRGQECWLAKQPMWKKVLLNIGTFGLINLNRLSCCGENTVNVI